MNVIKEKLSAFWNNKAVRISLIGLLSLVIIAALLATMTSVQNKVSVKDNHPLSSSEKATQNAIQKKVAKTSTSNADTILLNKVLKTDGQWQLVQVNHANDRYNYAYVILSSNEVKIGPATDITLEEMIKIGVPDSIIDYLYPDKPQWIGFDVSAFDQNREYTESIIKAWALKQNITLERVTRTGDITHSVINARELDEAEQVKFSFFINKDAKTAYSFISTYTLQTGTYVYSITNANGAELFTYTK